MDLKLPATTRTQTGRHARALRREGQIPAVLYGHATTPVSLSTEERLLQKIWHRAGTTHFIDLAVDGGTAKRVLIRDLQINPRTARLVHVDFLAVNMREKMTVEVPLVVTGDSPAVTEHKVGQLLQIVTSVKVECLPQHLPAQLSIDVSDLTEVDAMHTYADIELPEGVELVHVDPAELVVKIAALRVQAAEDEDVVAEAVDEEPAEGAAEGDEVPSS